MTFNDIFKSSFLENVTAVSILDIVLALTLAFCLGLFIFFIYKKSPHNDHDAGHPRGNIERRPLARYGRRSLDRPFQDGNQGAA